MGPTDPRADPGRPQAAPTRQRGLRQSPAPLAARSGYEQSFYLTGYVPKGDPLVLSTRYGNDLGQLRVAKGFVRNDRHKKVTCTHHLDDWEFHCDKNGCRGGKCPRSCRPSSAGSSALLAVGLAGCAGLAGDLETELTRLDGVHVLGQSPERQLLVARDPSQAERSCLAPPPDAVQTSREGLSLDLRGESIGEEAGKGAAEDDGSTAADTDAEDTFDEPLEDGVAENGVSEDGVSLE
jgi:hypothetical protein